MDREYYEKFFNYEREHWYFLIRSKIIRNIIKQFHKASLPLKILNIGVATGATSQMLMEFGDVTSVEFDKECCEFVSKVLNTKVYNESITALPFKDNSFDLVCAFDVIEHVDEDDIAVKEMNRVCKQGGDVYITVPAFMSLWSNHDIINHHKRRYILPEIKTLFAKYSGIEIYSSYFNSLLFPPILLFRQLSRIFSKKNDKMTSDFDVVSEKSVFGNFINTILGFIFSLEIYFLRLFKFPFGVSIIFLWKKS